MTNPNDWAQAWAERGGPDTEAGVVAILAQQALEPKTITEGIVVVSTPQGLVTFKTEEYQDHPARFRGVVHLTREESFGDYVLRHAAPATVVYAVEASRADSHRLVAVLNDHEGVGLVDWEPSPGWRDWRAEYTLEVGESWKAWTARDGQPMKQAAFVDFLEERIGDVTDPPEAQLLSIVSDIHATRTIQFRSVARLSDGTHQLTYVEEQQGGAGPTRDLAVPEKIRLALEPIRGSGLFAVDAHFRYRVSEGGLTITVKLDRVAETYRAAFEEVVDRVRNTLNGEDGEEAVERSYLMPVLYGVPNH